MPCTAVLCSCTETQPLWRLQVQSKNYFHLKTSQMALDKKPCLFLSGSCCSFTSKITLHRSIAQISFPTSSCTMIPIPLTINVWSFQSVRVYVHRKDWMIGCCRVLWQLVVLKMLLVVFLVISEDLERSVLEFHLERKITKKLAKHAHFPLRIVFLKKWHGFRFIILQPLMDFYITTYQECYSYWILSGTLTKTIIL